MSKKLRAIFCVIAVSLAGAACGETAPDDPFVQPSDTGRPAATVTLNAEGVFSPGCVTVGAGDIVRFDNKSPLPNANVTSIDDSRELYSPNLSGAYLTWQHLFEAPGRYEYFDSNSGDPGRRVVDAYYGTVTFIGKAGTVERGYACVERPDVGADLGPCDEEADCDETSACECPAGVGTCELATERRCLVQPLCNAYCCDVKYGALTRCPEGFTCNEDNRCVDGCTRTSDCPEGKICGPERLCINACRESRECPPGFDCNTTTGTCEEPAP